VAGVCAWDVADNSGRKTMKALFLATTMIAGIALPGTGLAQDEGASTSAEPGQNAGLEEIVVTAQRRTENLQRAAVAVSAVTGADLVNSGITETANLGRLVPSLVVQPTGGTTSFLPARCRYQLAEFLC
jgi:iron complex outermembrane recepter protein